MAASEAFKLLIENLQRSSRLDANVLINGEVGTGRRQCAVSIHKASPRAENRFVTVNCTALNDSRFSIEMFGMQNSAFEMVRKGAIFLAEEGTLYLHEVAELSLDMQAQLVRYLESSVFTPVGSNDVIASNVRIVCSTSSNLTAMVEAGRFRNDLFHMLCQMVINTPTLNERIADIDLLAANILREIAPGQPYQLHRQAYNRLLSHSFTGNLIELKNILMRAISQSNSYVISEDVMHYAISGGSVFAQAQDMQNKALTIESTMEEQIPSPMQLSKHQSGLNAVSTASAQKDQSSNIEPEISNSRPNGRWKSSVESTVDAETVQAKLNEMSNVDTQIDDISKDPTASSLHSTIQQNSYLGSSVSSTPVTPAKQHKEKLSLKERELLYIEELMIKHNGDKQVVANLLGCTVRTLYRKIEKIKSKSN